MVSIACAAGRQATPYRPAATAGYRGRLVGEELRAYLEGHLGGIDRDDAGEETKVIAACLAVSRYRGDRGGPENRFMRCLRHYRGR